MKLGVISDTHGHEHNTLNAIRLFESFGVDVLIHCGDIGSPDIAQLFPHWPVHFVFGNIDQQEEELQAAIKAAGHTCHGRFGSLVLDGVRIAFLHGDDSRRWEEARISGKWDLICFGHTHKAEIRRFDKTLLLNPGAVYRANPHSVAVVDLPQLTVEFLRF